MHIYEQRSKACCKTSKVWYETGDKYAYARVSGVYVRVPLEHTYGYARTYAPERRDTLPVTASKVG